MGLDDLLISTGVDQLIKLARDRGKIEIGQAAKELSIPLRTAEDWAHVLEEEGLISIEYKLTKIYIVWKAPTAEYVAKKSEKLQEKTGKTREEIEQLLSKVEEGGRELSEMQTEIAKAETVSAMGPQDIDRMKKELALLSEKQAETVKAAGARLAKLQKKVAAFGGKSGLAKEDGKSGPDLKKEIEVLRKFEETVQSELEDAETFIGAFEARGEEMRRKIEEGGPQAALEEVKSKLDEIISLKTELSGAIEAVSEEQKELAGKMAQLQEQVSELSGKGGETGAKKQLAELGKMEADAKRQKAAIVTQLQETLLAVKKQEMKLSEMAEKQGGAHQALDDLKNEYVDISAEVSNANEELFSKQKEISEKISSQMAALEISRGGSQKVSRDELQKISFLLRELKREQSLLEESVKVLLKEFEIIKLQSVAVQNQGAGTVQMTTESSTAEGQPEGAPAAFVEKVKLSEEEENEFERKRQELRSLIRKMWEEGKGGAHS